MSDTGRRTARARSINPTVLLGVLLPLLTVGVLLLVQPHEGETPARPPHESTLENAALGCPSAPAGGPGTVEIASAGDADGKVEVQTPAGGGPETADVAPGEVTEAEVGAESGVVRATGALAPGLVAARFGSDRLLAATPCPAPVPETWFTGVGAGARHNSVLELVNPDAGPAVADVAVYGRRGLVDAPGLRGVTVPGHDSTRLDLAEVIPKRSELALHVVVSRGRLAASVLDDAPSVDARRQTQDWMPAQATPTMDAVHLGLAPLRGDDQLTVANPGEDEARVQVKVVTEDAAFAPKGLEELAVPPLSVGTISLTGVLREALKDGAIGIQVIATSPVTSTLRSTSSLDLSFASPVTQSSEPMTLAVPSGSASVVLGDAESAGVATVTSWSADGKELDEKRVELRPGTGGTVALPKDAALVRVTPERTSVRAVAIVSDPGTAVAGFRELMTQALLPDVEPGLP